MAKKPREVDTDDDFDSEEVAQKGKTSPIDGDKLQRVANSIASMKADMDEIRGSLGQEMKQFEEDGGHKWALKTALKFKSMETIKAQDAWRSLESYMEQLGIFDQHDLFDPIEVKQRGKGVSVKKEKVAA